MTQSPTGDALQNEIEQMLPKNKKDSKCPFRASINKRIFIFTDALSACCKYDKNYNRQPE